MDKVQSGLAKIPILLLGFEEVAGRAVQEALTKAGVLQCTQFSNAAAFARSEKPVPPNSLIVLASSEHTYWEVLEAQNVSRNRVLHFFPEEIVTTILSLFPQGTSALENTQTAHLPNALLQLWDAAVARQLEEELSTAHDAGMLQLIASLTEIPPTYAQDRARLAFALGNEMFHDFEFLQRTIRLALFLELADIPRWQDTVANAKNLWSLSFLLDEKNSLQNECAWPAHIQPELAIVESANLALSMLQQGASEREFRAEIKRRSMNLPFSLRTALRIASERVLRSLWERRYDVA